MHLKKLEIQGFKSFADKLYLNFDKGITAIVGPNGSGKSNVADAIRWVLGEQSVKTLRGAKMEDVIFAGTENRKPLGYAQVTITFDNIDGGIASHYSELEISRRVYRSGESEYYLNKSKCRLKDIHELLMDTGIGKESYSIIGQGQIDTILSTKPEERRAIFEEAAGIVKFKSRKEAAEKKIEAEKQNLLRVTDILREIEGQIEPLKKQAEATKVFMEKREQLKNYEINLFLTEHDQFKENISALSENLSNVKAQIQDTHSTQNEIKEQKLLIQEKASTLEAEIEGLKQQDNDCKIRHEKVEGAISVLKERALGVSNDMIRIGEEIEEFNIKIQSHKLSMDKISENQGNIHSILKCCNEEMDSLKELAATIDENAEKMNESASLNQNKKIEILEKISDAKTKLERVKTSKEKAEEQLNKLYDEQKTYLLSQEEQQKQEELTESQQKVLHNNLELISQQYLAREKSLDKLKALVENYERAYQEAYQRLQNIQSELDYKGRLEEEYQGFSKSVQEVMKFRKQYHNKSDIHGVVADIISIDKKYDRSIEIALGGSVQHVIVKDDITAGQIIQYLKKNRLGRATFLPLSMIQGRVHDRNILLRIQQEKGFVGFGHELITCDEKYKQIISRLLGNTIIAENFASGSVIAKKYGKYFRVVTLEGEQFNIGGSITGGQFHKDNKHFFERKRLLENLAQQKDEIQKKLKNIYDEKEQKKLEVNEIKLVFEALQQDKAEKEKALLMLQQELHQNKFLKNHVSQKLKEVQENIDTIVLEQASYKEQGTVYEKDVCQLEKMVEELSKIIEQHQEQQTKITQEKDTLYKEIADIRVKINSNNETMKGFNKEEKRLSEEIIDLGKKIINREERLKAHEEDEQENKNQVKEHQEEIKSIANKLVEIREGQEQKLLEKKEIQEKQLRIDKKYEDCMEQVNLLEKEKTRLENLIEKAEEKIEFMREKIWEDYELTYSTCINYRQSIGTAAQLHQMASHLRTEIKRMGHINMNAIEEYDALIERFEFMTTQKQDILDAEEKLEKLIDDLTKAMHEQFLKRFDIISKQFNQVFSDLFGGGKGILKLADSKNALESGVEIIAQPPGKKLQNMMLLSGGERALTAIALLFAIQQLRPAPFCVLDEIEAALDDANVGRFANYLSKLADEAQYIVITHRKGTMEAANALYGITMQEKGISTSVSVKFENVS